MTDQQKNKLLEQLHSEEKDLMGAFSKALKTIHEERSRVLNEKVA